MGAAELVRRYYERMDGRPLDQAERWVDELAEFFTADATIRSGNGRAHDWRTAFVHPRAFLPTVAETTRHEVTSVVEGAGGHVACELTVTYALRRGGAATVNGSLFAVVRDGRFAEQRLYADFAPVLRG